MHPLRRPPLTGVHAEGPSRAQRHRPPTRPPEQPAARRGPARAGDPGTGRAAARQQPTRPGPRGRGRLGAATTKRKGKKKSGRPKSRRKGGVDSPVRDTRKIDVTPDGNKQREPKVRLPASRLSGSAVAELRRRELDRLGMAWWSPAPRWAGTGQGADRPRPPRALPVLLGQGQVQLLFRWPFPAGRLCPWRAFQTIENQPHLALTGNISIEF